MVKLFEIFEKMCEQEDFYELFEMANIHSNVHGINDVVIWVGKANMQHGLRIKISNMKNKFDPQNNFVIQMPSLDYNPNKVAKWITTDVIEKIKSWVKLNQDLLYRYENGELDDTLIFLNSISKV
jgi:hypothetical protein